MDRIAILLDLRRPGQRSHPVQLSPLHFSLGRKIVHAGSWVRVSTLLLKATEVGAYIHIELRKEAVLTSYLTRGISALQNIQMQSEAMQHHFGRLAHLYDELRSPTELVTPLIEALIGVGDRRGRRVLDVGCGMGRTLTTLTLHCAVQGWGIDVSAEMLEVARAQVPEHACTPAAGHSRRPPVPRLLLRASLYDDGRALAQLSRCLHRHLARAATRWPHDDHDPRPGCLRECVDFPVLPIVHRDRAGPISHQRDHCRRGDKCRFHQDLEETLADAFDLEIELKRKELADLLDRALALLPPETRTALIEQYIEESPLAEIAASLGISLGTAAKRLQRGKLAFRRILTTVLKGDLAPYLITKTGDGWEETPLWCSLCGQQRLSARTTPENRLQLNCLRCHASSSFPLFQRKLAPETKSHHRALAQILSWIEHRYRPSLAVAVCTRSSPPAGLLPNVPVNPVGKSFLSFAGTGCSATVLARAEKDTAAARTSRRGRGTPCHRDRVRECEQSGDHRCRSGAGHLRDSPHCGGSLTCVRSRKSVKGSNR